MRVSRAMLARAVLGVAVAVCAVSAVLTLLTMPARTDPAPPSPAAALSGLPARAPTYGERVVVQRVVDAVTFDARLPDGGPVIRVRALGVQPPGECYGAQATAFASQVLENRAVTLRGVATDRFDRRLATVDLDGADYAVLAAEAGIARVYATDAVPAAVAAVRDAQDRARGVERGVWGVPCRGATGTPTTPAPSTTPTTTGPTG